MFDSNVDVTFISVVSWEQFKVAIVDTQITVIDGDWYVPLPW